mgnify:CR=1 FL=1
MGMGPVPQFMRLREWEKGKDLSPEEYNSVKMWLEPAGISAESMNTPYARQQVRDAGTFRDSNKDFAQSFVDALPYYAAVIGAGYGGNALLGGSGGGLSEAFSGGSALGSGEGGYHSLSASGLLGGGSGGGLMNLGMGLLGGGQQQQATAPMPQQPMQKEFRSIAPELQLQALRMKPNKTLEELAMLQNMQGLLG